MVILDSEGDEFDEIAEAERKHKLALEEENKRKEE